MIPNGNIFCNTPWYELHIYWDGSFGICCQESHKLYKETDTHYNIARMSIKDWFNSEPVRTFRTDILGNDKLSLCTRCYKEESHSGNSRRLRGNQKSVIFTKTAFNDSFEQSPGNVHFLNSANNNGYTNSVPIDLHVDLGNFCNLACKMCNSMASSTIASQNVQWGIVEDRKLLGTDWTRDESVWNSFKEQLLEMPGLRNIHFMGGETLLTPRFENFIDTMIEHKRFDLCFSFVTNGTTFKPSVLDKLMKFQRVGLEVSVETLDDRNAYQRQGTDTQQVLENLRKYNEYCNGTTVTISLRPAISILTIGGHAELLHYALDNKFIIKNNLVYRPKFLTVGILPEEIKALYKNSYLDLLAKLDGVDSSTDYNTSHIENVKLIIKDHVTMCISLLDSPTPPDSEEQLEKLVRHCEKWDKVYGYNARIIYPEFSEIFDRYDYSI